MKRTALQNKRVRVLRMAFRARKDFGTFEKRAPGLEIGITEIPCPTHSAALPPRGKVMMLLAPVSKSVIAMTCIQLMEDARR